MGEDCHKKQKDESYNPQYSQEVCPASWESEASDSENAETMVNNSQKRVWNERDDLNGWIEESTLPPSPN